MEVLVPIQCVRVSLADSNGTVNVLPKAEIFALRQP